MATRRKTTTRRKKTEEQVEEPSVVETPEVVEHSEEASDPKPEPEVVEAPEPAPVQPETEPEVVAAPPVEPVLMPPVLEPQVPPQPRQVVVGSRVRAPGDKLGTVVRDLGKKDYVSVRLDSRLNKLFNFKKSQLKLVK